MKKNIVRAPSVSGLTELSKSMLKSGVSPKEAYE